VDSLAGDVASLVALGAADGVDVVDERRDGDDECERQAENDGDGGRAVEREADDCRRQLDEEEQRWRCGVVDGQGEQPTHDPRDGDEREIQHHHEPPATEAALARSVLCHVRRSGGERISAFVSRSPRDRFIFTSTAQLSRMSDKDLLALVLGGVALLMFATGIILAV
jgi:hypothetical protein